MTSTASAAAAHLLQTLQTAANVEILDETHELFAELYEPNSIISSLIMIASTEENVGSPSAAEVPPVAMKSQAYAPTTFINHLGQQVTSGEMPLEIHNTTTTMVRMRWIDEHHHNPTAHRWDIAPSSTFEQYTQSGHIFLLSLVHRGMATNLIEEDEIEHVLGAYRPKRPLPSCSPHCLLIGGGDEYSNGRSPYILETLLLDGTKYDNLVVAGAALDHVVSASREQKTKTFSFLKTIVSNVVKHPEEDKYRKLRLSNARIRAIICKSWGALELLHVIGFSKTRLHVQPAAMQSESSSATENGAQWTADSPKEDFLILQCPTEATLQVCKHAMNILAILQSRMAPNFILDIAPPTPWQEPILVAAGPGSNSREWNSHLAFITDEERWARAERNASRNRSGAARRPNPGDAPSSRGNWGR
jgi:hypothetical protein